MYGGHYSPHVHYRADVRPEDKHTARTHNFAYSDSAYAAQDPSSHTHHTPTRAQQALPRRSSLRSSADRRAPAATQPHQPAPFRDVYLEKWRRARALCPHLFAPSGTFSRNVDPVSLPPSTPQAARQQYNAAASPAASPDGRPRPVFVRDTSPMRPNSSRPYATDNASSPLGLASRPLSAGGTGSAQPLPTTDASAPSAPTDPAAAVATDPDSRRKDGHFVVSGPVSFKYTSGICALSITAPWEDARSLEITVPISVNDFYIILQRAVNLECAYFASIVPGTPHSKFWEPLEMSKLHSLVIAGVNTPIGGVLDSIRQVAMLQQLHVTYSVGSTYHLWADEHSYFNLFQRGKFPNSGKVQITSSDEWYALVRADLFRHCLQLVAGNLWAVEVE